MSHLLSLAALATAFAPLPTPKPVLQPLVRCSPLPSRAQCKTPTFWVTCGDAVSPAGRAQCAAYAQADLDALGALPSATTVGEDGAPRNGLLVEGYEDRPRLSGLAGAGSGAVLELTSIRRDRARVSASDRQRFRDNCAVTSCDEYVFDKYFELADFEVRTADLFSDPVARFEALYGSEGLARKRLRDIEGRAISAAPISLEARRGARNHFLAFDIRGVDVDWARVAYWSGFGPQQGPNIDQSLRDHCTFDADQQRFSCGPEATNRDLLAIEHAHQALVEFDGMRQRTLQTAHAPTPALDVDAWDYHESSATTLASQPAELLLELYDAGQRFLHLSERRYAATQRISDLVGWLDFFESGSQLPPHQNLTMITRIRASLRDTIAVLGDIDRQVIERLDWAERAGCLDNLGPIGPCDWSHQWVLDELDTLFVEEREADYQRCVELTGGDFSVLHAASGQHWLQTAADSGGDFCAPSGTPLPNCSIQQSYIATPRTVETYMSTVDAWFDSLPVPRDPETGQLMLGQGAGDEAEIGDGAFGADYDYGIGYTTRGVDGGICAAELDASIHLNADVTAFGLSSDRLGGLLRASVATSAGPSRASASVAVRVLGLDVYVPEDFEEIGPDALRFSVAEVKSERAKEGVSKAFFVGPVPFHANAGFAGDVGLELGVDGGQDGCPGSGVLDTSGAITPFVKLGAYAGVAVGVDYLASAGVRTRLTLLDFRLPFDLSARFPATGAFRVQTELTSSWTLLRGKVELYAEIGPKEWTKTFVRWPGHGGRSALWSRTYGGDSETLVRLAGGGDTARPRSPDVALASGRSCRVPVQLPAPNVYVSFDDTTVDPMARTLQPVVGNLQASYGATVQPGASGLVAQGFRVDGTQSDGAVLLSDWGLQTGLGRGPHTMLMWFRPETDPATSGPYDLLGFGDAQAGFRLVVNARGRLVFESYQGAQNTTWNTLLPVVRNQWQPLLLEIGGGEVRVTLSRASASRRRTLDLGASALRVGASLGSARGGWTGAVDELAAWSQAFEISEQAEAKGRGWDGRPLHGPGAMLPVGVTNLVATPGRGRIDVSWTNPPGLGAEFDRVQLYVSSLPIADRPSGGLTVYAGTADTTSLSPVANGRAHHIRAFALRPDGSTLAGPAVVVTPSANLLPAPTAVRADPVPGGVRLSWRRPASPRYDAMVVVRRTDRAPRHPLDGRVIFGLDDIEHLDTGLVAGATGYYGVTGVDISRQFGPMVTVQAAAGDRNLDVIAPAPVAGLSGTSDGVSVTLSWTLPSDGDLAGVRVERSQGSLPRYARVFEGRAEGFVDARVTRGVVYNYRVVAFDRSGNRSLPRSVRVTADDRPPPVVEGLTATQSGGQVTVLWTAPSTSRVLVRRSRLRPVSSPRSGTSVFDGTGTSFVDASPPAGAVYYTAFAEGVSGPGEARAVRVDVGADVPPDPVTHLHGAVTEAGLALSWRNPTDSDLASVEVRHGPGRFDPDDPTAPGVTTAQSALTESALIDAYGPRHVAVVAIDRAGQRSAARWSVLDRPVHFTGQLNCPELVQVGQTIYLGVVGPSYSDGSAIQTGQWRQLSGPSVSVATSGSTFRGTVVAPSSGLAGQEHHTFTFEFVADGRPVGSCSVRLDVVDDRGMDVSDVIGANPLQTPADYGFTSSGHLGLVIKSTATSSQDDLRFLHPVTGAEVGRLWAAGTRTVAFDSGYAYLTRGSTLGIYDLANLASPTLVGFTQGPAFFPRTFPFAAGGLIGHHASSSAGATAFQLSVGPPPSLQLGTTQAPAYTPIGLLSLDPSGQYLYAKATNRSTIRIVGWPGMGAIGQFAPDSRIGIVRRLDTVGGRLVALGDDGLQLFDVSTPTSPSSALVQPLDLRRFQRAEGSGNRLRIVPAPMHQFTVIGEGVETDAYLEVDVSNLAAPVIQEYVTPGLLMAATTDASNRVWTSFDHDALNRVRLGSVPARVAPTSLPVALAANPLHFEARGDQLLWLDDTGVQLAHYEPTTGAVVLDGRINQALVPSGATEYPHLFQFVDDRVFIPSARANEGVFEVDVSNPAALTGRFHLAGQSCNRAARTGRFLLANCPLSLQVVDLSTPTATPSELWNFAFAVVPVGPDVLALGPLGSRLYGDDGAAQPALRNSRPSSMYPGIEFGKVRADHDGGELHLCCFKSPVRAFDLTTLSAAANPNLTGGQRMLQQAARGPDLNWYITRGGDLFAQRPAPGESLIPKPGARMHIALPMAGGPTGLHVASDGTVIVPLPGQGLSLLRPSGVTLNPSAPFDVGGRQMVDVSVQFDATLDPIRHAVEPAVRCASHQQFCQVTASDIAAGTATVRWEPGSGSTLRVSVGDAFGYAVGTTYGEAP